MPVEMVYTSAPAGLARNSQGFCVVAATRGASAPLLQKLEQLTGYKAVFGVDDPRNPVNYFALKLHVGGKSYHAVGRVGPCGVDYSGRANKLAHVVAFEPSELPAAGPAALLRTPGFTLTEWSGQPRHLEPRTFRPAATVAGVPSAWAELTDDAGHAGVVLDKLRSNTPVALLVPWGCEALQLVAEAWALMPEARRWGTTFATFPGSLPPDVGVDLRCYPAASDEGARARKFPTGFVLELAKNTPPATGASAESARAGRPIVEAARPAVRYDAAEEIFEGEAGDDVTAGITQAPDDSSAPIRVDDEFHLDRPPGGGRTKNVALLLVGSLIGAAASAVAFAGRTPPTQDANTVVAESGVAESADAEMRAGYERQIREVEARLVSMTHERDRKAEDLVNRAKELEQAGGKVRPADRAGYPAPESARPETAVYAIRDGWTIVRHPIDEARPFDTARLRLEHAGLAGKKMTGVRMIPPIKSEKMTLDESTIIVSSQASGPRISLTRPDAAEPSEGVEVAVISFKDEGLELNLVPAKVEPTKATLRKFTDALTDRLFAVEFDDGTRYVETFLWDAPHPEVAEKRGEIVATIRPSPARLDEPLAASMLPEQNVFDGVLKMSDPRPHYLRFQFGPSRLRGVGDVLAPAANPDNE